MIEERLAREVIGYFSYYRTGNVLCDGDACVISGTKDLMHAYRIRMTLSDTERPIVKKTKFGEIIKGLEYGAAYALDKKAYVRFFPLAKRYGLNELPEPNDFFLQKSTSGMHFIRIQVGAG